MKHLIKTTLLLLVLLLPTLTHAHDFEVDGIYYNINGTNATVTFRGTYFYQYSNEYSGSVTIPATVTYGGTTYSVTTIGDNAFYTCTSLTTINIPNSVTTIGDGAFSGCSGLTSISVANNNPKYDSRNNCNAIIETATNTLIVGCKNTIIPNSVTSIGDNAFYTCTSLTTINIPNSVTSIGDWAFCRCTNLTTIDIPNSVTYIGLEAFLSCESLTTINIPNSVTSINAGAFRNCSSLSDIYCYATTPPECIDYVDFYTTFNKYYSVTLHVPAASLAAYLTAHEWSKFEKIVGDAVAPTGITISRDSIEIQSGE